MPIPEKNVIPTTEIVKQKLTPQLHLFQIRFLSVHPTTVNSEFTNGHETLF